MLHNTYSLCENVIKHQLKHASKSRTTIIIEMLFKKFVGIPKGYFETKFYQNRYRRFV